MSTPTAKGSKAHLNTIHVQPLPLKIHVPLPLLPHNPISLLHVTCSYVWQLFFPTPRRTYGCYFSPETRSVHVTDQEAIRALWESGFFGKGNLSRSELSWLAREQIRRGILSGQTSEDITSQRREERKAFKQERAKKERDAIERKLREEAALTAKDITQPLGGMSLTPAIDTVQNGELADGSRIDTKPTTTGLMNNSTGSVPKQQPQASLAEATAPNLQNQEHMQLTLEEAFFLAYGLGILQICEKHNGQQLSNGAFLTLARRHSYFPPRPPSDLQPDDPFLISYVVYHHFRSLGWVVRPGVKFGVDYLLYLRGPVFSHAEFAVVIMPSFTHEYWTSDSTRAAEARKMETRPWWWFHCVNRVQSQVRKHVVLAYVEIPPPESVNPASPPPEHIGKLLQRYSVREMALKRWIPNRCRD